MRTPAAIQTTTLGGLAIGTGAMGFALALAIGSLAPALVGLVLLGLLASARAVPETGRLEARRELPLHARVGEPFEVRTHVQGRARLPIRIYDPVPPHLDVEETSHSNVRGEATLVQKVVPRETGKAEWTSVHVEVMDPWALWSTRTEIPAASSLPVHPEPEWSQTGRRLSRRHRIERAARSKRIHPPVPDIEYVREHRPGDRVRDIDWARTSRSATEMFTKERERIKNRPFQILLDASATMRKGRHAKLTTGVRLVHALVAAARAGGVRTGIVVFHDGGVDQARSSSRRSVDEMLVRLGELDAPRPDSEPPLLPDLLVGLSSEERVFLQRIAPYVPGPMPGVQPLDGALRLLDRAQTDESLVVAILDAEPWPKKAEVVVRRLRQRGHKVICVVPATGAHHYYRHEAEGATLRRLRAFYLRRERLRRTLIPMNVPLFVVRPDEEEKTLTEVLRWAT